MNEADESIILQDEKKKTFPVIALVGQPNSGKTSLFNNLTNSNYKTSNYAGTTVEYGTGKLSSQFNFSATVVDSPGIISLNPSSPDEEVTIENLFHNKKFHTPDLIIVTADSTQLSRQLFIVKQLIDCNFKVIVALTMNDMLAKKDLSINEKHLGEKLGCAVVKIDSRTSKGIESLIRHAESLLEEESILPIHTPFKPSEQDISDLYDLTESIEREVLTSSKNGIDINAINDKYFHQVGRKTDSLTQRLDKIFLHPVFGMFIFIISMGIIFTSIFWIAQPLMDLIDSGFSNLSGSVSSLLPADTWYNDLITNGLINGLGSVLIFLPQIVILLIILGILEDTGYLARAAMLIDKPLSMIGLNGRSFLPMLSGYACAIPAIMSARTIPNRRERLLTIMVIPLMSCSARLPVYALLLAYLTPPDKPWIAGFSLGALYLFSLVASALVAGLISRFKKDKEKSTFMLELPAYRKPIFKFVFKNSYYKTLSFVKGAGPTIIFVSLILWCLTFWPDIHPDISKKVSTNMSKDEITKLTGTERLNNSFAAMLGNAFEPVLKPVGWDWRIAVSLISAFAAREVFVSSMAITFSITDDSDENIQSSLLTSMREAKRFGTSEPVFTTASTIALIIYFMFAMQCLSTVAVARKETGSWKIPILQVVVYTVMAYVFALGAYHILGLAGIK